MSDNEFYSIDAKLDAQWSDDGNFTYTACDAESFGRAVDEVIAKAMKQPNIFGSNVSKTTYSTGAQREEQSGRGRYDLIPSVALKRWAKLMELGASKYSDRNWEKGMPISRYLNAAMRHLIHFMEGDSTDDNLASVLFNIGAIMHHQEMIAKGKLPKELDDLPKNT